jgi:AraC-like DNA-binding protein
MLKEDGDLLTFDHPQINVLDDVIETLRFQGTLFFHSDLAAPWGMSVPKSNLPRFHVALNGSFFIGANSSQVAVKPMDIVLLPGGDMHWIADEVDREMVPSQQVGNACELGKPLFQKGPITNRLMCGVVNYDDKIIHPILSSLPEIIHLSDIQAEHSIWVTIRQIDAEVLRSGTHRSILIDRLTEVLFIQLLHKFADHKEHLTGFLGALQDPQIALVLQMFHSAPEREWTLETLSDLTHMSRATLQRKFKACLDVSPMTYLSYWRMAKAYQLIRHSTLSFESITEAIGFAHVRSLRSAFHRRYGITPSTLRKLGY